MHVISFDTTGRLSSDNCGEPLLQNQDWVRLLRKYWRGSSL